MANLPVRGLFWFGHKMTLNIESRNRFPLNWQKKKKHALIDVFGEGRPQGYVSDFKHGWSYTYKLAFAPKHVFTKQLVKEPTCSTHPKTRCSPMGGGRPTRG
eukprot:3625055-Amphidinium_carterae.1